MSQSIIDQLSVADKLELLDYILKYDTHAYNTALQYLNTRGRFGVNVPTNVTTITPRIPPSVPRTPPNINLQPPIVTRTPPNINLQPPIVPRTPPNINLQPPIVPRTPPNINLQPITIPRTPPNINLQPITITRTPSIVPNITQAPTTIPKMPTQGINIPTIGQPPMTIPNITRPKMPPIIGTNPKHTIILPQPSTTNPVFHKPIYEYDLVLDDDVPPEFMTPSGLACEGYWSRTYLPIISNKIWNGKEKWLQKAFIVNENTPTVVYGGSGDVKNRWIMDRS
jgi:hypothetical protein